MSQEINATGKRKTPLTNQRGFNNLVPTEGLEPPHLAAHGPEPCASTNSATWAYMKDEQYSGYTLEVNH